MADSESNQQPFFRKVGHEWQQQALALVGMMETPVRMRVPGDIVFALGAMFLARYALRLLRRPAGQCTPGLALPAGARS